MGQEDPLEKGMETHSTIPAWRIPWIEESGGLQFQGTAKSQTRLSDLTLSHTFSFCFTDYTKVFDCVDHNKLWKILKEMGIPDHLTYFLRNLYAGQDATVRTQHVTTDWFKLRKGVWQDYILSPCLFNFYSEYIT